MTSLAQSSPVTNDNNDNGLINHTTSSSSSIFSTPKWPCSRRTLSFSSSSFSSNSSSSFRSSVSPEDGLSVPNSPSTSFTDLSSGGIPFSWESIPGIPKKQTLKINDSSRKLNGNSKSFLLPLPPAAANNKSLNHKKDHILRRDPFFTALVECSKGGDEEKDKDVFGGSIWKPRAKSLSTRFGSVNMSCKNSSSVADSLVYLPKGGPRRIPCNVIKTRSV